MCFPLWSWFFLSTRVFSFFTFFRLAYNRIGFLHIYSTYSDTFMMSECDLVRTGPVHSQVFPLSPLFSTLLSSFFSNFLKMCCTVNWGDFGHFSNLTICISFVLIYMPTALPGKLESQFLLEKNCGILGLKMFERPLKRKN